MSYFERKNFLINAVSKEYSRSFAQQASKTSIVKQFTVENIANISCATEVNPVSKLTWCRECINMYLPQQKECIDQPDGSCVTDEDSQFYKDRHKIRRDLSNLAKKISANECSGVCACGDGGTITQTMNVKSKMDAKIISGQFDLKKMAENIKKTFEDKYGPLDEKDGDTTHSKDDQGLDVTETKPVVAPTNTSSTSTGGSTSTKETVTDICSFAAKHDKEKDDKIKNELKKLFPDIKFTDEPEPTINKPIDWKKVITDTVKNAPLLALKHPFDALTKIKKKLTKDEPSGSTQITSLLCRINFQTTQNISQTLSVISVINIKGAGWVANDINMNITVDSVMNALQATCQDGSCAMSIVDDIVDKQMSLITENVNKKFAVGIKNTWNKFKKEFMALAIYILTLLVMLFVLLFWRAYKGRG